MINISYIYQLLNKYILLQHPVLEQVSQGLSREIGTVSTPDACPGRKPGNAQPQRLS